jgi:hypothetical protein
VARAEQDQRPYGLHRSRLSAPDGSAVHFVAGLVLLARLTPRLTSEFALRTFLNTDLDRTS